MPNTAALTKNAVCQLKYAARKRPIGTPAAEASANDDITIPIARPRRSNGIKSATMVYTMAASTPPKAPSAIRASINVSFIVARTQASVARPNRMYKVSSNFLRPNRSP